MASYAVQLNLQDTLSSAAYFYTSFFASDLVVAKASLLYPNLHVNLDLQLLPLRGGHGQSNSMCTEQRWKPHAHEASELTSAICTS